MVSLLSPTVKRSITPRMDLAWGSTESAGLTGALSSNEMDQRVFRRHNEIYFGACVTQQSVDQLIRLTYEILDDESVRSSSVHREAGTITVMYHIASPGGYLGAAFKFVDFVKQLKHRKVRIVTVINSHAYSAATLMAMVADERRITQHATAMIHELFVGVSGKLTHLQSFLKYIQSSHDKMVALYQAHSKMTREEVETFMAKQTFFTSEEYLERGLVDHIV